MQRAIIAGMVALGVAAWTEAPVIAADQAAIDRAIARGLAYLRPLLQQDAGIQVPVGNPVTAGNGVGATALAALTFLECGVAPDDKAIQNAAKVLRRNSLSSTHTYSLSLMILFFDRLGDPSDVPLIESMTVRLLAGQSAEGGWSYTCPGISDAEQRRLATKIQQTELVGRRELPKVRPGDGAPKRETKEVSPEILQQLQVVGAGVQGVQDGWGAGDNSNTQFATIALWVARRHGLPVANALTKVDQRFRSSQLADGGWTYTGGAANGPRLMGSSATMTCAGLLGLAVGHGTVAEVIEEKKLKRNTPDPAKDANIRNGLLYLSVIIGQPPAVLGAALSPRGMPGVGQGTGKAYYFFWSLERVAVALDLEKINGKDWYNWGADILLKSQSADGSWAGEYTEGGADTCFALLFLRRANLTRDLSARMRGKLSGARELRAGGAPKGIGKVDVKPPPGPGSSGSAPATVKPPEVEARPRLPETTNPRANPRTTLPDNLDPKVAGLARELMEASGAPQDAVLERLRTGKGVMFTEALAAAIPQLAAEPKQKARTVLAERLARMKVDSLVTYLTDEDTEIRRAAALACAMKEAKGLIPNLIKVLNDPEPLVVRAAHAALKDLSGQDFGPPADATRAERAQAIASWQVWWSRQGRN